MKAAKQQAPQTIEDYIASYPVDIQKILQKIRMTIRQAAPAAGEKISYQIPTFTFHGNLVHFAAFKNHIGFYPAPGGIDEFKDEVAKYRTGKGTLQFPLDQPIPYDLIVKIVKFRMQQNLEKAEGKTKKGSN